MKGISKADSKTERGRKNWPPARLSTEISKTIKETEKGTLIGNLGTNIPGNGKITKCMEKGL